MIHPIRTTSILLAASLFACDSPEDAEAASEAIEVESAEAPSPALHAAASAPGPEMAPSKPAEVVPDARRTFEQVVELIETQYVEGPLHQDILWTAATQGVLDHLIQLPEHRINKLLSPRDLAELEAGTKGRLLGVGIIIERVADVVVVRGVIPSSPAEQARIAPGDRILGIDGERVRELDLEQIVDRIRGEEGSRVELFLQRDTEEWNETLTRGEVEVPSVEGRVLSPSVGYVRLTSFGEQTPDELDQLLSTLQDQGMKSLVLDLRHCPGGLFEEAIETSDRFLAPGLRIVTLVDRDGKPTHWDAQTEHAWQELPLVVLVGEDTASGGEIMADALAHHGRGTTVGTSTMGKSTVESIMELGNGWGLKLSISRFELASGRVTHGQGLKPQIRVPGVEDARRTQLDELSADTDPQLAAALELLQARSP
jgi:carboxyl-terminal processing protease